MQEQVGVRQPEPVNALFHIADHKQIAPAERRKNGVLDGVGILILIDHNLLIACGKRPRKLCRLAVFEQQPDRKMLEVVKIRQVPAPLLGRETLRKRPHRVRKAAQRRSGQGAVDGGFPGGYIEQFPRDPPGAVLPLLPHPLEPLQQILVREPAHAFEPCEGNGAHSLDRAVPVGRANPPKQRFSLPDIVQEGG